MLPACQVKNVFLCFVFLEGYCIVSLFPSCQEKVVFLYFLYCFLVFFILYFSRLPQCCYLSSKGCICECFFELYIFHFSPLIKKGMYFCMFHIVLFHFPQCCPILFLFSTFFIVLYFCIFVTLPKCFSLSSILLFSLKSILSAYLILHLLK